MKRIEHTNRPKINEVVLQSDPLIVWLTPKIELRIRKGDSIARVLKEVVKYSWMNKKDLRRLIAYWFALGERLASGRMSSPWSSREMRSDPDRTYLA